MRNLLVLLALLPLAAVAQESPGERFDQEEYGSGFVAFEAGQWRILGEGDKHLGHPTMFYLTTGFSVSDREGWEPLRLGPKFGLGLGTETWTATDTEEVYDLLFKARWTFGGPAWVVRPYVDFGPGYIRYNEAGFDLEAGAGVNFHFPKGSAGVNAQYKELFGAGDLHRGVVFLGSLAYQF